MTDLTFDFYDVSYYLCCLLYAVVALGAISGCLNFERRKEPRGNIGLLNFERKIRLKNEGIFTEQEFLNFGIQRVPSKILRWHTNNSEANFVLA